MSKAMVLEREEELQHKENKVSELTESLETSNDKLGKLKHQFQNRLKALKEKLNEATKVVGIFSIACIILALYYSV
jgi:molecular chaperone GrpE (heat shock protein)